MSESEGVGRVRGVGVSGGWGRVRGWGRGWGCGRVRRVKGVRVKGVRRVRVSGTLSSLKKTNESAECVH